MFIVAVMIYIRRYKQRKIEYLSEIQIKNEIHQKELLAAQLEIQQTTMQQIGRELHDNIGQKLTLASLYIQQVKYENADHETERINQVSQIINHSLQDLRSLSKTLTDDNICRKDIVTLIAEEAESIVCLNKCAVHFEHDFSDTDLHFVHKNVLLRITQEFIQNSMKNSGCKNIFIQLKTFEEDIWELNLRDDGSGFETDHPRSSGIGLTNMKNRAALIGAEFSLQSRINEGTTISIKNKQT